MIGPKRGSRGGNYRGNRSLIDHIFVSDNMKYLIDSTYSIDNVDNESDHVAVITELKLNCDYFKTVPVKTEPRIAWYKANLYDIDNYKLELDKELSQV